MKIYNLITGNEVINKIEAPTMEEAIYYFCGVKKLSPEKLLNIFDVKEHEN